ncbi:hypothetical protein ACFPRL_19140 [Pseudoclavibacter helvolus]
MHAVVRLVLHVRDRIAVVQLLEAFASVALHRLHVDLDDVGAVHERRRDVDLVGRGVQLRLELVLGAGVHPHRRGVVHDAEVEHGAILEQVGRIRDLD